MMKRRSISYILTAIFFMVSAAEGVLAQKKAQDVIKMLQKRYDTLNDFTADLLQVQAFEFSGVTDTTQLIISLLKKDYFKIETPDVILVTDGKTVKEYSIYEQKVTIDELGQSENSFLPREFLFDFPKRYTPVDFRREARNGTSGFTIVMEPKKPDEEIMQTLEVWIDAADSLVKYVRYSDFNDNENRYNLSNYKVDIGLTPQEFEIIIPEEADVRTIDLRRKK